MSAATSGGNSRISLRSCGLLAHAGYLLNYILMGTEPITVTR